CPNIFRIRQHNRHEIGQLLFLLGFHVRFIRLGACADAIHEDSRVTSEKCHQKDNEQAADAAACHSSSSAASGTSPVFDISAGLSASPLHKNSLLANTLFLSLYPNYSTF